MKIELRLSEQTIEVLQLIRRGWILRINTGNKITENKKKRCTYNIKDKLIASKNYDAQMFLKFLTVCFMM